MICIFKAMHHLKTLEICVLKVLDPAKFLSSWFIMTSSFKKGKVKLDLLSYIDMLIMVKKTYKMRNKSIYLTICKR